MEHDSITTRDNKTLSRNLVDEEISAMRDVPLPKPHTERRLAGQVAVLQSTSRLDTLRYASRIINGNLRYRLRL